MTSHDNVTDIVETLRCVNRAGVLSAKPPKQVHPICEQAADTIATLRKQLENAREALQTIVTTFEEDERQGYRSADKTFALDTAREALKGQPC